MNQESADNAGAPCVPPDVRAVLDTLSEQEKVLILCNEELYGGRWDLLTCDLVERLEGRPYIFKLGERIRDDIERVRKLRAIEEKWGIRLGDFVKIE